MGLNIVSGGGNFDPWVKFNSKAGRFYIKGDTGEVEVAPTSFVADLGNIKTGWISFVQGQAPVRVWDADLLTPAVKPSEDAKRGFSLRLYSKSTFNGVVELSSNSLHLCTSITELYSAYEAQAAANPGLVPVVKYTGATVMKDKMGNNYKPNFVIEKWTQRPVELDEEVVQEEPVKKAVNEF